MLILRINDLSQSLTVLVVVGLALGLFTYQFWLTLIILGAAFAIWWFTRR